MTDRPKYALPEFERRWLVGAGDARTLMTATPSRIRDRYLDGTRLRLRRVIDSNGQPICKLGKKYGDGAPGAESITNLYLTAAEFDVFDTLAGWVVEKLRYRVQHGSLDRYRSDADELLVFEREFADPGAAADYRPPPFAGREITADPTCSGAALAQRFGHHAGPRQQ